jgi:hypothetical protein
MPTIEELQQKQNVQLVNLPNIITAKLVKEELKNDTRGKECLFWDLEIVNGGSFTQKISRGFYAPLMKHLELVNVTDTSALIGKTMEMTKYGEKADEKIMPDSHPRWFPTKIIS